MYRLEEVSQRTKKQRIIIIFLLFWQDQQIAVVENDISKETLEVSHTKTRVERLQKSLDGLDEEIKQKNEIISKSLSDITKRNATIERKQGIIDQHNKKLELMISQAGVCIKWHSAFQHNFFWMWVYLQWFSYYCHHDSKSPCGIVLIFDFIHSNNV